MCLSIRIIAGILMGFVLVSASQVFAVDLSVVSVQGASSAKVSAKATRVIVEGGLAGGDCASSVLNSQTCDSCSSRVTTCSHRGFCACNATRISNGLVVRVNLRKTEKIVGNALAVAQGHGGSFALRPVTMSNLGEFADFTWSSICASMGNSNCSSLPAGENVATVRIGIDTNQDGILSAEEPSVTATFKVVNPGRETFDVYGEPTHDGLSAFQPFAGDRRVFIEAVTASGSFPSLAYGAKAAGLRVFISDRNVLQAGYDGAIATFDMPLDDTGVQFQRNEIPGLTNGVTYYFHTATVDEAGNVVQFVPGSVLPPNCAHPISVPNMDPCFYSATPSMPIPTP